MFPNITKDEFDRKYAVAKSKNEKLALCLELIYAQEKRLANKDEQLQKTESVLQQAYALGKAQADEMDRFWAAFGLLNEKITIDDAIAFFKDKDKRIAEFQKSGNHVDCSKCEYEHHKTARDYESRCTGCYGIAKNQFVSRK